MVHWKPFKSKFSLYSSVTAEGIFFAFTSMMYGFLSEKEEHLVAMGWTMISMVVASLGTSWVCVVFQQIQAYQRRLQLMEQKAERKLSAITEKPLENLATPKPENQAEDLSKIRKNDFTENPLDKKIKKNRPNFHHKTKGFKSKKNNENLKTGEN